MEFALSDEQQMIADTVRAFFTENATSERTRAAMAASGADAGIDAALWQAFCTELGLSGVAIPEEAGGAGLGLVELALIAEAAGAQVAALPLLGSLALAAQALAAGGTEAQKQGLLPALLSGETIAAYVHVADLVNNDNVLNGADGFVAHGTAAQVFVVTSNSGAWLVRAGAPGLTVTAQTTMDQTRPLARVALDGVRGEPLADAAAAIARAHACGYVTLAAEALGGAQAALHANGCSLAARSAASRPTSTASPIWWWKSSRPAQPCGGPPARSTKVQTTRSWRSMPPNRSPLTPISSSLAT
jgi:alkylation response protein AidB-like acyl-CoA dehydrogenase